MRSRFAAAAPLLAVAFGLLAVPFAVHSADPSSPRFAVRVAPDLARHRIAVDDLGGHGCFSL